MPQRPTSPSRSWPSCPRICWIASAFRLGRRAPRRVRLCRRAGDAGGHPEYLLAAPPTPEPTASPERPAARPTSENRQTQPRQTRQPPPGDQRPQPRNRENAPRQSFSLRGGARKASPEAPQGPSADSERGLAAAGGDPATVKRQGGFSAERARVASEPARPVRARAADRGGVGPAAGGSKAPHPLICVGVLRGSRSQGAAVTLRFEGQRLDA